MLLSTGSIYGLTSSTAGETGAAIAAAIIPFLTGTGTGNLDITSSAFGGGTPILAMFMHAFNANVKSGANDAVVGYGAADGTSQFTDTSYSADNQTTGGGLDRIVSATDQVMVRTTTTISAEAAFSAFLTNGVRVNIGDNFASSCRQTAIVLGGADLTVAVGTVTPTTGGATVTLGWQPDAIILVQNNSAFNDTVSSGFLAMHGFAAWDSGGSLAEATAGVTADTGTTRLYRTFVQTDCCLARANNTADTFAWKVNATRSGTGFTLTSDATSSLTGYIAIKLANGGKAKAGTWALPTGTGAASKTGVGFKPRLVLLAGTARTATGVGSGELFGLAAMAREPKAASLFGSWVSDGAAQGAGNPSDTRHVVDNDGIFGLLGAGATDFDIELTSIDADGWTVNVTDAPAAAYLWTYLAIG